MSPNLKVAVTASAAAFALFAPAAVQAAAVYGSGAIATARPCIEAAAQACVIRPTTTNLEDGGMYQQAISSFDLGNGSSSLVQVGFDESSLPTLRGAVTSSSDQRVGSNVFGFRSYTYEGTESIDLALEANVHFVSSGDSGELNAFGDGQLSATLLLLDADFLTCLNPSSTGREIYDSAFRCGTIKALAGVTSVGYSGENNLPIELASVRLNPGETFVIGARMQLHGNRGGFLNALNTFDVDFDLARTALAGSDAPVSREFLNASITSVVPEPSTWALVIAGFGLAGMALRRRLVAAISA